MTPKQWMLRARNIDAEINALEEARIEMFTRLTSGVASADGSPVQATSDPHKFERYADLFLKINDMIDNLYETKEEILSVVNQIPDNLYRVVLIERYINGKTWEQISVDMHYTYKGICNVHGRALLAAKEYIDLHTTDVV